MTLASESAPVGDQPTARLFFALCPPADVAERLHAAAVEAAQACGGRIMRLETLHLTLAFLGEVALDRLDELCGIAAAIEGCTLYLNLDRIGWWRHNQIVWAGLSEHHVSHDLPRLAAALSSRLVEAGFHVEQRAFVPHVTLLRKAGRSRKADTEGVARLPVWNALAWPVVDFVLVRSLSSAAGTDYRIVGRWPLHRQ
jgi:2'-5' RNA ligase